MPGAWRTTGAGQVQTRWAGSPASVGPSQGAQAQESQAGACPVGEGIGYTWAGVPVRETGTSRFFWNLARKNGNERGPVLLRAVPSRESQTEERRGAGQRAAASCPSREGLHVEADRLLHRCCPWEARSPLSGWVAAAGRGLEWKATAPVCCAAPQSSSQVRETQKPACGLALEADCYALGPGGACSAPAVSPSLDSRSSRRLSCLPAYLSCAVSPPGLQRWRAPSETKAVLWGRGVRRIP